MWKHIEIEHHPLSFLKGKRLESLGFLRALPPLSTLRKIFETF